MTFLRNKQIFAKTSSKAISNLLNASINLIGASLTAPETKYSLKNYSPTKARPMKCFLSNVEKKPTARLDAIQHERYLWQDYV